MLRQDCSFRRLKRRSKTKNFLSIFCRLPPHPPPGKKRKVRKVFGFSSRDRRERTRRASLVFSLKESSRKGYYFTAFARHSELRRTQSARRMRRRDSLR